MKRLTQTGASIEHQETTISNKDHDRIVLPKTLESDRHRKLLQCHRYVGATGIEGFPVPHTIQRISHLHSLIPLAPGKHGPADGPTINRLYQKSTSNAIIIQGRHNFPAAGKTACPAIHSLSAMHSVRVASHRFSGATSRPAA